MGLLPNNSNKEYNFSLKHLNRVSEGNCLKQDLYFQRVRLIPRV